jgi:hypothetical protein
MPPLFRALCLFSVLLFASASQLPAQDMALRVEAVRLLERSNAVSRSTRILPNRKLDVTFRAYTPDGVAKDGTYSVIYAIDSERYETHFGDYSAISIHLPDKIVQSEFVPPPIEALEVHWLTPLVNGRFDEFDTINSITPVTLFGRRAKCIQFETVKGRSQQSNEICLDEELGAIVRYHVGEDLVENTDYFSFEGVLFPATYATTSTALCAWNSIRSSRLSKLPSTGPPSHLPMPVPFSLVPNTGVPSFSPLHNRPQRAPDLGMTCRSTAPSDQMGMSIIQQR